jgi:porphyrinogen peroxidase
MAGLTNGTRDALTRFTQPLTGSYYFVPSVESLLRLRKNGTWNLLASGR